MVHCKNFRIEELNPFLEWHLHGSTDDINEAMSWAQSLSDQINRSVRVIDFSGNVIILFEVSLPP